MKSIEEILDMNKPAAHRFQFEMVNPNDDFKSFMVKIADLIKVGIDEAISKIELPAPQPMPDIAKIIAASKPEVVVDLAPVARAISQLKEAMPRQEKPEKVDLQPLIKEIRDLKTSMSKDSKVEFDTKRLEDQMQDLITVSSKKYVPPAVTKIDLNPLRGSFKTTAVTVTGTATALPSSALANRRAVVIYNNGAVDIFIGGSDVTTSTGIPVPAGGTSPSFDAGSSMTLYAISGGTSVNTRVLEISNDAVGSS